MVIKMTACNGQPVAKISDSPGKTMCRDEAFVSYLRHVRRRALTRTRRTLPCG